MLQVTARGIGETWLVASSHGIADSVLVKVTADGYTAGFSSEPPPDSLVVGRSVQYAVKVVDRDGHPLEGQRVNFGVTFGTLSAATVRTDGAGEAAVTWTLPKQLANVGELQRISFRTELPNGIVETGSRDAPLLARQAVSTVLLVSLNGNTLQQLAPSDSVVGVAGLYTNVYSYGLDEFGNATRDPVSVSNPASIYSTHSRYCGPWPLFFDLARIYHACGTLTRLRWGVWPGTRTSMTVSVPGTPVVRNLVVESWPWIS
jgi:hypothetical protein